MNTPPLQRLSLLKLDGFRPGAAVLFCPRCDFQDLMGCRAVPICPKCDASLHVACVTADLVQLVQARAA